MNRRIYITISILLFMFSIVVLSVIDRTNNIVLSLTIQIILILYLARITWGSILYIRKQYSEKKYSYSIIMNLGLVIFLIINIARQINLLIVDWNETSIKSIYNNTLTSFSYFAYLIVPLILIIAFYSILTNIILIIKEGFKPHNLLGIIFGIVVVLGASASQFVFVTTKNMVLIKSSLFIKKFIDIGINSVLCYFYCLTLATLYCNVIAGNHKPKYDKDFVIILGSRIRKDGTLTPLLRARVDRAIEFAENQKNNTSKDIIFIPSGGKGEDEIISESKAMYDYLLSKGINSENIIIEDAATNTRQNIIYSKKLIDGKNKDGNIIFSTTNYHVFRSGVIANNEGVDCEGIGSKTKWYFYTNALIREFFANIVIERKRHIALITLINIILFILVYIGFYFKLI